jgi:acetate---CoA ligase (ADP-forming)
MDLEALLNPRSIAVLGASERPSLGRALISSLDQLQFKGRIYAVNPKYQSVLGHSCYASLLDLPDAPDVVAFCVAANRIPENMAALADRGGRGAVIYDAGFAERGEEGRKAQETISAICREVNIALCGPNCMGILNTHTSSSTYMDEVRDIDPLRGNVALVSQSGSICMAMVADVRRFGYSFVISSGNEATVCAADYLESLIKDSKTKVIALFIETVRESDRFIAALDCAANAGKPVVVLKVGRNERTRHAITSHTGGLAGESRVLSEVLRAHRAIEVSDLDEMTEVLAVCQGERWPAGRRIAVLTGSGGQAELILDVATASGIELPPLPQHAREEVERVIGPLTGDGNPLDFWGNGNYKTNLPHAYDVVNSNPDIDAVVYCNDSADGQPTGRPERRLEYMNLLIEAARKSDKPHYFMTMRSGVFNRDQSSLLTQHGIAVIGGSRQGLGAIDRMARHAAPLPPPRPDSSRPTVTPIEDRRAINEFDAKSMLREYGVPVTRERLVASLLEAEDAAREIGFPVALKVVSDDIPHKSDLGLVAVNIGDPAALVQAWETLQARIAQLEAPVRLAGFLVQEMIADGVEIFAGVARDPEFGLSIAVGTGGTAIEVFRNFALRMLPLRQGEATAMVAEIADVALLNAIRGQPSADKGALVACVEALGDFSWRNRAQIAEIDLNPIKVLRDGRGCVAVDALIVTQRTERA